MTKKYEVWRNEKQVQGVKNIEELKEHIFKHHLCDWDTTTLFSSDSLEEAKAFYEKTEAREPRFDKWNVWFANLEEIVLLEIVINNEGEEDINAIDSKRGF